MFFDSTVYFVVGEEGDVLSPEETMCEIFDLAETHFFLFLDYLTYSISQI